MQRALSVSRMTGNRSTFPEWYQAVVREADLAENSPVRGMMIIKPWGYGVWEEVQRDLDRRIKETKDEKERMALQALKLKPGNYPETYLGVPIEQVDAARDLLMNFPEAMNLPALRNRRAPVPPETTK